LWWLVEVEVVETQEPVKVVGVVVLVVIEPAQRNPLSLDRLIPLRLAAVVVAHQVQQTEALLGQILYFPQLPQPVAAVARQVRLVLMLQMVVLVAVQTQT
jgi:hypothetical protein